MNPLVSVIVPVYNTEKYVEEAVSSILSQSYTNIECIVINDCSTDGSVEKLARFTLDNRVVVINLEKRVGVGRARNIGQSIARGTFIAFCDSDDFWHRDKLVEQVGFLIKNNLSFTCTSYYYINSVGGIISIFNPDKVINYSSLLNKCDIGTSTVIYNKEVLGILLMPGTRLKQDYLTWLCLLKDIGEIKAMCKPLVSIRVHTSSNSSNKLRAAYYQFYALNLHLATGIFSFELMKHFSIYVFNGFRKHNWTLPKFFSR